MTGDEQAVKVEHEYLFDKNTLQKKEQDMDNSMKITAGLGSIDEYERFVQAGADEFFCGYVPFSWAEKYGTVMPLNRREVLCCNVQLCATFHWLITTKKAGKKKHADCWRKHLNWTKRTHASLWSWINYIRKWDEPMQNA